VDVSVPLPAAQSSGLSWPAERAEEELGTASVVPLLVRALRRRHFSQVHFKQRGERDVRRRRRRRAPKLGGQALRNSPFAAITTSSGGTTVEALPLGRVREILTKYNVVRR
jgi:hypothetical protein